jgi:hypothetical protein
MRAEGLETTILCAHDLEGDVAIRIGLAHLGVDRKSYAAPAWARSSAPYDLCGA